MMKVKKLLMLFSLLFFSTLTYAEVSDEIGSSDEKALLLNINSSVEITTTSLPDWTEGSPYSQQLVATGGTGIKSWSDKNNNLTGTGLTLSATGLISGTPLVGPISFTAEVIDEAGDTEEILLSFTINDALSFVTTFLPDGTEGTAYSEQIDISGGTGVVTYSDLNSDLAPFGLNISSNGLVSGTPTDTGTAEFTVHLVDEIGANIQLAFSFHIEIAYICGDADNDGEDPNVADLTFLVDYIFKGGEVPPILEACNVDGLNGNDIDVADLVYLVDYIFKGGDEPICE